MPVWDDLIRGREVFLQMLRDDLDEARGSPAPALEVMNRAEMEMYERACDSGQRQGNFSVAYSCVLRPRRRGGDATRSVCSSSRPVGVRREGTW